MFEELHMKNVKYGSFGHKSDWELGTWLFRNVGQTAINSFLRMPMVSSDSCETELKTDLNHDIQAAERSNPSFTTTKELLNNIDALPCGPSWTCELLRVEGDMVDEAGVKAVETIELWKRDPVECIRELIGNPVFRSNMAYAPEKHYTDSTSTNAIYGEAWTGEWWWNIQVHLLCLNYFDSNTSHRDGFLLMQQ